MRPTPEPGLRSGTRLWLARHAEVDERWRGRTYGRLDVPLSDAGRRATARAATAFAAAGLDAVVASPLARSRQLGEAVARAAGAPLEVDERLVELDRGRWQGRTADEVRASDAEAWDAWHADPWGYAAHGGERDADVHARAWPALLDAARRHEGGTVFLATHYNVIRVLLAQALGVAPARSFALRVDPGRAALVADLSRGWVLLALNVAEPGSEAAEPEPAEAAAS